MRAMSAVAPFSYKHWLAIVITATLLACATRHPVSTPTDHVSVQRQACANTYTGDNCTSDSDCPSQTDCLCDYNVGGAGGSGSMNLCLPSNCRSDADCGPGGFCSPSVYQRCARINGYFCHGPGDECGIDADCASGRCAFASEVGHWICAYAEPCTGG